MADEVTCQRCGEGPDPDLRPLRMSCLYEMDELGMPFKHEKAPEGYQTYKLLVCKNCRAEWMAAVELWFKNVDLRKHLGTGIFVRHYGANLEITEAEWERMRR